jgi:hypothetical protein
VLSNGQVINGEVFTHHLEGVRDLLKYQVVQESFDKIAVRAVVGRRFERQDFKNALSKIQSVFTCPVETRYEMVDSIEATGRGKHHIIISDVLK